MAKTIKETPDKTKKDPILKDLKRNRFIDLTFWLKCWGKYPQNNQKQNMRMFARSYYFDLQIIIIGDFFDRLVIVPENI